MNDISINIIIFFVYLFFIIPITLIIILLYLSNLFIVRLKEMDIL
jgi:hypothetical protein